MTVEELVAAKRAWLESRTDTGLVDMLREQHGPQLGNYDLVPEAFVTSLLQQEVAIKLIEAINRLTTLLERESRAATRSALP